MSGLVYRDFLNHELLCYMHEAFKEYSEYFENDIMLDFMSTIRVKNIDNMVKKFENVIHNQQQKMRLYNFIFYKLFVINQDVNISSRLKDTREILNFILNYEDLFMSMSVCTFEKVVLGKQVSSKDFINKLKILKNAYNIKSMNLKLFGYSIHESRKSRIHSLEYIVNFYGIDEVIKVFKKIKNLNSVFKEDYDYLQTKHHLFPGVLILSTCDTVCSYNEERKFKENHDFEIVDSIDANNTSFETVIGMPLEENNASCDSMMNYYYFVKANVNLHANKKINKKLCLLHDII